MVEKVKEGRNLGFRKFLGQGWVWVCERIDSKIFVDPPQSTCGGVYSGELFASRLCDDSLGGRTQAVKFRFAQINVKPPGPSFGVKE